MNTYCGFIAIIGKPNVGKSNLINRIIGKKISITSDRIQTTRYAITGVKTLYEDNQPKYQLVLVDTPGLEQKISNKYSPILNKSVLQTLQEVDIIVWVIEAHRYDLEDHHVLQILQKITDKPIFLAVNKIDKAKTIALKTHLQQTIVEIKNHCRIAHTCQIAAKHNLGITALVDQLKTILPASPFLFPVDQDTTRDDNFIIQELIREKTFRYLGHEIPYTIIIELDQVKNDKDLLSIKATIFVTKESNKGIVIGAGGDMLKKIATESRQDLERHFNKKVFLNIWVKFRPGKQINLNFE